MKGQRATIKALERRLKSSQKDNVRWAKLMEDTVNLLTEARGALDMEGGNEELVASIDVKLSTPSTATPEPDSDTKGWRDPS